MKKNYITVSSHKRAFPKRKFADGGAYQRGGGADLDLTPEEQRADRERQYGFDPMPNYTRPLNTAQQGAPLPMPSMAPSTMPAPPSAPAPMVSPRGSASRSADMSASTPPPIAQSAPAAPIVTAPPAAGNGAPTAAPNSPAAAGPIDWRKVAANAMASKSQTPTNSLAAIAGGALGNWLKNRNADQTVTSPRGLLQRRGTGDASWNNSPGTGTDWTGNTAAISDPNLSRPAGPQNRPENVMDIGDLSSDDLQGLVPEFGPDMSGGGFAKGGEVSPSSPSMRRSRPQRPASNMGAPGGYVPPPGSAANFPGGGPGGSQFGQMPAGPQAGGLPPGGASVGPLAGGGGAPGGPPPQNSWTPDQMQPVGNPNSPWAAARFPGNPNNPPGMGGPGPGGPPPGAMGGMGMMPPGGPPPGGPPPGMGGPPPGGASVGPLAGGPGAGMPPPGGPPPGGTMGGGGGLNRPATPDEIQQFQARQALMNTYMPSQTSGPSPAAALASLAPTKFTNTPAPPGTPYSPPAMGAGAGSADQMAARAAMQQRLGQQQMPSLGMKKGGRVRQFGAAEEAAENLPPAPEKKAKGGVLRRRPTGKKKIAKGQKLPVPMVTDEDMDQPSPSMGMAGPSAPPPGPPPGPPPVVAPAGMNKGGECKMAEGGVAKLRLGYPNTNGKASVKKMAKGGSVRGCGVATKGKNFSGIY